MSTNLQTVPQNIDEFGIETEFATNRNQKENQVRTPDFVGKIGRQIGDLSVNIADMSGTVGDVSAELAKQLDTIGEIVGLVEQVAGQNGRVADMSSNATAAARQVESGLEDTVSSIHQTFSKSADDIQMLADSSTRTVDEFGSVKSKLDEIYNFSESVTKISSETQFLAINAGILAANTGEAGKGFAVIAESIRELAVETSSVSKIMLTQLDELKNTVDQLVKNTEANNKTASEAVERTDEIEAQISKFREFGAEVGTMAHNIMEISDPIEKNSEICSRVAGEVQRLNAESQENSKALNHTFSKFDQLVTFAEEAVLLVEQSGVETRDTPIIKLCTENAQKIEQLFETALSQGRITMQGLFDENYIEVTGSDPVQHITQFVTLTDSVLPDILEYLKEAEPRIVFAAAVDRNGYLPTHNKIYSHPQSDDPVWNAANCRNRRIFDDRTGAAAGANTQKFLMQTYRRDMGGGKFALMKDLSAPIFVNGRHWGGLRMGVEV